MTCAFAQSLIAVVFSAPLECPRSKKRTRAPQAPFLPPTLAPLSRPALPPDPPGPPPLLLPALRPGVRDLIAVSIAVSIAVPALSLCGGVWIGVLESGPCAHARQDVSVSTPVSVRTRINSQV